MNQQPRTLIKALVAAGVAAISLSASAADTTPPTLTASHTWIYKADGFFHFNLLLDPKDDQGIGRLEFRERINTTTIPADAEWLEAVQMGQTGVDVPWKPEEPLTLSFNCKSMVLQVRAKDTSGNYSEVITRSYKSPFPLTSGPNLTPAFGDTALDFTGDAPLDCRGLFAADFDGDGRDDLAVFDRTAGAILIQRQNLGDFTEQIISVTANSITDGAVADFDGDGRPDIAVVVNNTVTLYRNDGVNGNNLIEFTASAPGGLAYSGMSEVRHIVAGDVTGEGKADLIISGTGDGGLGGDGANVAVLINDNQFFFSAASNAVAPAGATPGRLALADFDGDGWTDAAMIDAGNKQVLVFNNRANGSFGGAADPDETLRPVGLTSGVFLRDLAPQSLAVGDVTGDGRPDIVITMHGNFGTGATPPPVYRNLELWQLFENRGGGSFHQWPNQLVSQSEETEIETPFPSDVILQDLNQDRLPELVFTSYFGGGIKAVRLMPWLNRQNEMVSFSLAEAHVGSAAFPQRLAAARFGINTKKDIVVANGSTTRMNWWFTTSNIVSDKPVDLIGGAATESNPNGIAGYNGALSYTEYPGGRIDYSLSYINNSANALTGAIVECALPKGLNLLHADEGSVSQATSGTTYVRWTLDIPAASSGVKNLSAIVHGVKANATVAPKIALKQGAKALVSGTLPVVKILGPDLTVMPSSSGQPWSFTFKPLYNPPAGAEMLIQGRTEFSDWSTLNASPLTRTAPTALEWVGSTSQVPPGLRYFRIAIITPGLETGYSSVFGAFLPETTGFKVSSKSPPKSGNVWTFTATQPSTAANLTVRFQSTETPFNEGSWTDLPVYEPVKRAGNVWTSVTYNVPSGTRYFRAISAAPGWKDDISAMIGPVPVQQSDAGLPLFTLYHVDFKDPATYGQPAAFMATCASVPGLKVRFQTRLFGEGDEDWTDLTDGTTTLSGTKWTFKTNYMPIGDREWRAIASAPGYLDNTLRKVGTGTAEAIYRWEVLPAPLPQIPTIFGTFEDPADGSLYRTGVDVPVSIKLFDFNGVNRVFIEAANSAGVFKEVANTNLTNAPDSVDWSTTVRFTGTGTVTMRVAVTDLFTPAQTCYSNAVTVTVGPGNGGGNGPTFGAFANTLTQATLKKPGAVSIKLKIGDDSQVRDAFVHRTNAAGQYVSTVAQMARATTANPSDFTCMDGNLSDGTYYYRVVAHDYDGNESISTTVGPFAITTPAPAPSPIHLNIAAASRLVAPTFPPTKFNYAYLPMTTSGMVDFSYSGLPSGANRFVAYRTDLGPNKPYWQQTVTKTSGTLKIKAPWWKESSVYPHTGEGQYAIVCFQGSNQIAIDGASVNTFTVGHSWQTPDTFKTLDWGLYWFKNGNSGLRGIGPAQQDDYFDAGKPTVIYVHGWQPGEVKVGRRESWLRQDPYKDSTFVDCCKIWKDQGYNVGIFNWNQFGDGDLLTSQENIYRIATEDGLPSGHSMIYSLRQPDGSSTRHYLPAGEGGAIEDCTVVDLFLGELLRCLGGYQPSSTKEFRMIGHSLGTQVVGRSCDAIRTNPGWGIPLPTRVCLLELAQINGLTINGLGVPARQEAFITGLVNKGVAVECYQSTDLQSLLGVNLAFVGGIHDMSAYCRWRPDFIQPVKVGLDVFQKSHNEIVRWYMQSFQYNEFPAFTYWSPFVKRDAVGKALSASTSTADVKKLMGGSYWYEQSEGKNTATITDDQYERKTR